MLVRSGQEALHRQIHQPRIQRVHRVPAEAQPIHRAGSEILDQRVGVAHHVLGDRQSRGRFQVDADAALVAVEIDEETGGETMQPARAVAVRRRFHADHVGAEIGQHHAAGRAHDGVGEFEDREVLERHHGHVLALLIPTLPAR